MNKNELTPERVEALERRLERTRSGIRQLVKYPLDGQAELWALDCAEAAATIAELRAEVEQERERKGRWKKAAKANRRGWQHCAPEFWTTNKGV